MGQNLVEPTLHRVKPRVHRRKARVDALILQREARVDPLVLGGEQIRDALVLSGEALVNGMEALIDQVESVIGSLRGLTEIIRRDQRPELVLERITERTSRLVREAASLAMS